MDRLTSIEAFIKTVEENGFSPAARKMGIAVSSVTRLVNQLEHHLGTTLLNRSTRKVTPTAHGASFYRQSVAIIRQLHEAEEDIRDLDAQPRGLLKISMPVALGRLHIMPIVYRFMIKCPAIKIETYLRDTPIDMIDEDLDISIRIGDAPSPNTVPTTLLARQRWRIVGTPTYFDRVPPPHEPADIAGHACMTYFHAFGTAQWRFTQRNGGDHTWDVPLTATFRSNNGEALLGAVTHHLGIALLPDWLVRRAIDAGGLISVLDQYIVHPHGEPTGIYMIYPENRAHMKKVRTFADFLKQWF